MDGVKGLLQSRVIWSSLIALVGTLLNKYGYEITAADQATLVDTVSTVMAVGGSIFAIVYRVKATKQVIATPVVKAS